MATDSSLEEPKFCLTEVIKGTEAFEGPDFYNLKNNPRGFCVIFNNKNFPDATDKNRLGSEFDVERMKMLFQEFNFRVEVHEDLPSEETLQFLEEYAKEKVDESHDAFVLIMMSHGDSGCIYGNDDTPMSLAVILEYFNNSNCPHLKERPKLFFFQTCRGDDPDNGTEARDQLSEDETSEIVDLDAGGISALHFFPPGSTHKIQNKLRISNWSDMYIAYSVINGYQSLRDERTGSWFMKAVYEVMAEYAHKEDLDRLMNRVHAAVLKKAAHDGQRQCPEVQKLGWRKCLYFNPGF